ncbi:hypothetical protein [Streptomyces sp. NPDC053431]|uniref:hypothetical protein n=1 Tax=Streptomyces sp. NPDC053431 TaxID=3365703 RepID=UPI0037CFF778
MNTRIDTPTAAEIFWHDTTLCTCTPAVAAPEEWAPGPEERDDTEQERNIVRGED